MCFVYGVFVGLIIQRAGGEVDHAHERMRQDVFASLFFGVCVFLFL